MPALRNRDLIAAQKLPPDLLVMTEGCDCNGDAHTPIVRHDDLENTTVILIQRVPPSPDNPTGIGVADRAPEEKL